MRLRQVMIRRSAFAGLAFVTSFCLYMAPQVTCVAEATNQVSYSVRGTFTYEVFVEGRPEKPLQREFEVLVNDCSWRVRIVLTGNTNYDCFIYSYDGTNLAHYFKRAGSTSAGGGSIEVSPVPPQVTSAAGEYPWLAFASGCYFKELTTDKALAFEQLRSRNGLVARYEVPVRAALSSKSPYLPTSVYYLRTHQSRYLDSDGTSVEVPLPPVFAEKGFVGAQFKADGITNVHGQAIPTKFEYRKYEPMRNGTTTNDFVTAVIVRGVATNVTTIPDAWHVELPKEEFSVHDHRVREANVVYKISDGIIPETNSAMVRAAHKRALALNRNRQIDRRPVPE